MNNKDNKEWEDRVNKLIVATNGDYRFQDCIDGNSNRIDADTYEKELLKAFSKEISQARKEGGKKEISDLLDLVDTCDGNKVTEQLLWDRYNQLTKDNE